MIITQLLQNKYKQGNILLLGSYNKVRDTFQNLNLKTNNGFQLAQLIKSLMVV